MPLVETESLVLKTYNLAEADKIVVFFTRDHGVVRGVAKGARRLKSRFGSTLEPFSLIELGYFQKEDRELVSIQSVELIRSYFEYAADPGFLKTFSYIADLLLQFAPPNDPNETLYRMLRACLSAAAGEPSSLKPLELYFELWLLRLGGYLPDWSRCEDCKRPFEENEPATLRGSFHLHCRQCRASGGVMQVSYGLRELFRNVQRLAPNEFVGYAAERAEDVTDLSIILRRLISQIIGNESAPAKPAELAHKNAN